MIDKNEITNILREFNESDNQRELLIKKSRDVLKLSKQLINSAHREDLNNAKKLAEEIKTSFEELKKIAEPSPELAYSGSYKIAAQEYTEALLFYGYVSAKKLPAHKEIKVTSNAYLLGICDFSGELVRKAINDAIKGNWDSALEIKEVVEEIYAELIRFDFRENEIRKKFDSIKYDLKRLEDVALSIKLKK